MEIKPPFSSSLIALHQNWVNVLILTNDTTLDTCMNAEQEILPSIILLDRLMYQKRFTGIYCYDDSKNRERGHTINRVR